MPGNRNSWVALLGWVNPSLASSCFRGSSRLKLLKGFPHAPTFSEASHECRLPSKLAVRSLPADGALAGPPFVRARDKRLRRARTPPRRVDRTPWRQTKDLLSLLLYRARRLPLLSCIRHEIISPAERSLTCCNLSPSQFRQRWLARDGPGLFRQPEPDPGNELPGPTASP
jgi:hypothetical protein